jgi:hypothetical protein
VFSADIDPKVLLSVQFLADMLENEHRGIRIAAVEALTTITRIQLEDSVKPSFVDTIQDVINDFLSKILDDSSHTLYRRVSIKKLPNTRAIIPSNTLILLQKADIINLVAHLIIYINHKDTRKQVINLLVKLWRDPDSEVRITAIKMVQLLGESGIPEVLEGFKSLPGMPYYRSFLPYGITNIIHLSSDWRQGWATFYYASSRRAFK